jgi:hypothetical protein
MTTKNPYTLKPYEKPSNYAGETWEGWLVFLGRHRDSDLLTNHNFDTALKQLQAVPQHIVEGELSVTAVQENHWAVGWVEWIAVHPTNAAAVSLANELAEHLDDYPILDEDGYSMLECEETCKAWEEMSLRDRVEACRATRTSIFAARHACIPDNADRLYERLQSYANGSY